MIKQTLLSLLTTRVSTYDEILSEEEREKKKGERKFNQYNKEKKE
jgi:hypothetical protein